MKTLYGMSASGNCYKVRLALSRLGQDYYYYDVDSLNGETRTPAYLAINAFGQIPALKLEDGQVLLQSNAILQFLCRDTELWPSDPLAQQQVLAWLFWEQYSHEPKIAVARLWVKRGDDKRDPAGFEALKQGSAVALDYMEASLDKQAYLAGASITIADLALYAYTHTMADIGFAEQDYPCISAWLKRVQAQSWYVTIDQTPTRLKLGSRLNSRSKVWRRTSI